MVQPSSSDQAAADTELRDLRSEVEETDRALVELVNRRLELVARIKRRKVELGVDFLDPEREAWLLRELERSNRGPLTREGLAELVEEILALTKRDLERG